MSEDKIPDNVHGQNARKRARTKRQMTKCHKIRNKDTIRSVQRVKQGCNKSAENLYQ